MWLSNGKMVLQPWVSQLLATWRKEGLQRRLCIIIPREETRGGLRLGKDTKTMMTATMQPLNNTHNYTESKKLENRNIIVIFFFNN